MNDFAAEPSRASQSLAFYRILFTAGFSLLCLLGTDLLTLLAKPLNLVFRFSPFELPFMFTSTFTNFPLSAIS